MSIRHSGEWVNLCSKNTKDAKSEFCDRSVQRYLGPFEDVCENEEKQTDKWGSIARIFSKREQELHRYLLDVGDVQCSVDQSFVHGVFSVFAFFVQVHCLQ